MNRVAVVSVVKNERFIKDFIYHYIILGVDNIFIGDNGLNLKQYSSINNSNKVTIIDCYGRHYFQEDFYNEVINKYKYDYDWFIIVDADEFLILNDSLDKYLDKFINKYPDVGCIGFNWLMCGSIKQSIKNLFECKPYYSEVDSTYGKIIVRSTAVDRMILPHLCSVKSGYTRYHCDGFKLIEDDPCYHYSNYYPGYILHFYCKSVLDWKIKMSNGFPNSPHHRSLDELKCQINMQLNWTVDLISELDYTNKLLSINPKLTIFDETTLTDLLYNLIQTNNRSYKLKMFNNSIRNKLFVYSLINNNKLILI